MEFRFSARRLDTLRLISLLSTYGGEIKNTWRQILHSHS